MIWVAVDRGARLAREPRLRGDRRRVAGEGRRDQGGDPRARRPRRRLPPALRDRRARRLAAADPAAALPPPRRSAGAGHGRGDRRRPDRARPRPPLQGRGDRRRPQRQGGDLPDLLLLAGLGALGDRRVRAGARSSASGCWRRPAGSTSSPRSSSADSGRHLGNFPQAFTHLALINAVSHVIADEQREDGGVDRGLHRDGRRPRGRLSPSARNVSLQTKHLQTIRFRLLYIAAMAMASTAVRRQRPVGRPSGTRCAARSCARCSTSGGEISPRELAAALEQPLSTLSYHVRVLADCGAIALVRTKQIRGSTQHFYRAAVKARLGDHGAGGGRETGRSKGGSQGEEKG